MLEIYKKHKNIIILAQVVIIVMSLFFTFIITDMSKTLPSVQYIKTTEPEQSTQIFDINGDLVAEVNEDENRICVSADEVSSYFKSAVIAIEDVRYYEHRGVDLKGTVRAFVNNMTGTHSIQGGSTITQQLVKNWFLMPEKSFKRKFLEAILSARLENNLSKKEILEKYMNLIYLGNRAYGVEKAAGRYFDKKAKDLNLAESALLAGLIKAPGLYSPYTSLKIALERQKIVLDRMLEFGFITEEQWKQALNAELNLKPTEITAFRKYPYFVDHVINVLRERYGKEVVDRGGLKVYTTLDPVAQAIAEKTIIEGVKNHKWSGVKQGALVSIDVKTGHISAIVGGIDYWESQFNRATMAKRATGSGFKPIVYLTGFRLGLITPDSIILDAPIAYRTKWNVWRPHNWDGKYKGRMTVRQALTLSRNTPTVRVALEAGLDEVIKTARLLGVRSHIDRGYSVVLGSAGITPLEVATFFSTIAREGVYIEPTAIKYITDSKGNVIETNKHKPVRVVESKYVQLLNSILIDVVEKGTGRNAMLEGRQIAGKTGTTDEFKDVWFTGFTPDTVTTIWMGNDENNSLHGVWSSNCATLWKNFSKEFYAQKDIIAETFGVPEKELIKKKKKEVAEKPIKPPPVPRAATQPAPQQQVRPAVTPQQQRQYARQPQQYQYQQRMPTYRYPQQYQQPRYQQPRYQQRPAYQQYPQQYPQRRAARPTYRQRPQYRQYNR